ncbi:hypothetical protein C0993_001355, partial [Termitomyces sp. T159_Od127]
RPTVYKKGPDVGSKSERTRRRYRDLLHDQRNLDAFGFTRNESVPALADSEVIDCLDEGSDAELPGLSDVDMKSSVYSQKLESDEYPLEETPIQAAHQVEAEDTMQIREESVSPPSLEFDNDTVQLGLTGRAAAWAVRKYKGHRTISRAALMHLEALAPASENA